MSTSEHRAVDAESDLPLSAAELSALASQLYAASIRPGFDSPPQSAPVAPRGNVPDTTAAASAGQTATGSADQYPVPVPLLGVSDVYVPAPTSPEPEPPPQAVPVAPRGNVPDTTAAPSAAATSGGIADPFVPADLSAFAVPTEGIVPTVPGVLAGGVPTVPVAPRGSAPSWPTGAPSVPALGWTDTVPVAPDTPAGDEGNYHFLTAADPVPQLTDEHEVFDVNAVRADFPILKEVVNGKPLIWFDNAATTQKPQVVIDRLVKFYSHENSNIHRAAHELAARATDAYEEARDTVPIHRRTLARRTSCSSAAPPRRSTWWRRPGAAKHLQPGDEIVITHLEHHANIVPWQLLSQKTGAILKVAPVDDAGNLLLDEFEELLGPRTKLVSVTQVSNALGTVVPVDKIVELGHRYGAHVLIDGAQSIPHMPVDVAELGADFFVFSGHKIFGPTGIGALYGTEEVLDRDAAVAGRRQHDRRRHPGTVALPGPADQFEAGTGNIADAVGLAAALRYVQRLGIERIAAYEHTLLEYATPRLADIPGVRLVGTAEEKASVLSFVLAGHEPLEVGKALNAEGIAVRAGHHCAQPALRRFGLEATVRPSFAFYNTHDEIDVFLRAVRRIAEGGTNVG